jgi:excisionase family DNA binding protein
VHEELEGKPVTLPHREWCALMTNDSDAGDVTPIDGSLAGVKFLTVAEVASVMRVSKMSVYRMIHSGELEAARFGRSFRVPEKAVHDYLRGSYFETG